MLSPIDSFKQNLANLLRARFPYLYIPSWEEDRLLNIIYTISQTPELIRTTRKVFEWSLNDGLTENNKSIGDDTTNGVKALDFIKNYKEPALFILKDFHIYFGAKSIKPALVSCSINEAVTQNHRVG